LFFCRISKDQKLKIKGKGASTNFQISNKSEYGKPENDSNWGICERQCSVIQNGAMAGSKFYTFGINSNADIYRKVVASLIMIE